MKFLRMFTGIVALLGVAASLNFLVLSYDPFLPAVIICFGVGVVSGLVWVVLSVVAATRGRDENLSLQGLNSIVASVIVFAICAVIYAFVARPGNTWDLTQEGRRELAPQTIQLLQNLDQDVTAYCLFNGGDRLVAISREKTKRFLELCQRYTPHLKTEFIDPQLDPTILTSLKLARASAQGTIVLDCAGAKRAIPLSGETPRLEERDFTNTLINVIRGSRTKVYMLTGHGERSSLAEDALGASKFKTLLTLEAYDVADTAVVLAQPEIPADCDILIINQPTSDLYPAEIEALQAYLDRGGRLLLTVEPGLVEGYARARLYEWLETRYGIGVGEDVVLSTVPKPTGLITLYPDTAIVQLFEMFPVSSEEFSGCYEPEHPITRNFNETLSLEVVRSVSLVEDMPSEVVGNSLLRSTPYCWAETDVSGVNDRTYQFNPSQALTSVSVAAAVTAKTDALIGDTGVSRDARIVVIGDASLTENGVIENPGNRNFLLNAMAWLSENEQLIAIRPTRKADRPIQLSDGQEKIVAWTSTLGVLQLIVIAGLITFAVRRRYQ